MNNTKSHTSRGATFPVHWPPEVRPAAADAMTMQLGERAVKATAMVRHSFPR